MTKSLKLLSTLMYFAGVTQTSIAQEAKWMFLPSSNLFSPLLADPREPNNSLEISSDTTRYDLSLGGSLDLLQLEFSRDNCWGMGMMGDGYLLISRYDWASYRLEDSDLWYGFYISQSSGLFSNRLEYQHGSSHLGDWLFGSTGTQFSIYGQTYTEEQAFPYERDLIQFTASYQLLDFLRVYGGLGYWLYATPGIQAIFPHLGLEATSGYSDISGVFVRGFLAYDLKTGDLVRHVTDQNFQVGIQMKPCKESLSELHLALDYYYGNSEYGQFLQQRDNHFGIEISFLP